MSVALTESAVERATLTWVGAASWKVAHGPDVAPDLPEAERRDAGDDGHMPKREWGRR